MTPPRFRLASALRPNAGAWAAAVIVLTWVAVGLHLQEERAHAMEAARANAVNLVRAFSESFAHTVREIDQMLLFVRDMREREGPSADFSPWRDRIDRLQTLSARLAMTDRTGLVTMDGMRPADSRIDLSDRAHFRRLATHPDDGLLVTPPVVGRVSGVWTVQFVRMLRDRQGGFDGMLLISVPTSELLRFAAPVDLGPDGVVAVIGLDRQLRTRMTDSKRGPVAGTATESPAAGLAATGSEGVFTWTDPADGVARLEAFRRVPNLPLVISVGVSLDTVLKQYRADLPRLMAGEAAVTVLLVTLVLAGARDRRRRSLAQTALERTLTAISQGIAMVDPQGRVVLVNRRARELLGLPTKFGPGSLVGDIIRWQIAEGEFGLDAPAAGDPAMCHSAYKRTRPNGTVLEVRTHVLLDGSSVRTFSDVTAWERTQRALEVAREAAEAATRARSQFLAVMSHEIRTPLNGILGVADLLGDTGLTAEQDGYAGTIRECGRHLLDLLNDVLDFSKIDNGAIEIECAPFAPRAVLETVRAMISPQAEEKGLRVQVTASHAVPDRVLGDARRLRQVLLNLIGNAVKFTSAGEIEITLDAAPLADGWRLNGAVRDTGIGIAAEMRNRLFHEFSQVDGSVTRRFGGTGLGLAICSRLLDAMGGSITADSEPGIGTVFRFSLKVGTAPSEAVVTAPATLPFRRLAVLVAEDNRVNRLVATRFLERQGHAVHAVEDGVAAVEAIRASRYDLVLMDVMMPRMDGLAATRAIRGLPGAAGRVIVIGLTAGTSRADENACREAGMNGFAPKPITPERLAEEIAHLCGTGSVAPDRPGAQLAATVEMFDPGALDALEAALGPGTTAEIIATFLADAPTRLDHMRALAAGGAAELLAREAHALAGSAGTIGLCALAAAARALETGMTGCAADLPQRLAPLEALAAHGMKWLADRVPAPAEHGEAAA